MYKQASVLPSICSTLQIYVLFLKCQRKIKYFLQSPRQHAGTVVLMLLVFLYLLLYIRAFLYEDDRFAVYPYRDAAVQFLFMFHVSLFYTAITRHWTVATFNNLYCLSFRHSKYLTPVKHPFPCLFTDKIRDVSATIAILRVFKVAIMLLHIIVRTRFATLSVCPIYFGCNSIQIFARRTVGPIIRILLAQIFMSGHSRKAKG